MKKYLVLLLVILSVIALLVACTTEQVDPKDTDTQANTPGVTDTTPDTTPDTDPDTDAATDTDTDGATESETPAETEPAFVPDGLMLDHKRVATMSVSNNHVKVSREEDPDYGYVLKLTTTQASGDPFASFDIKNYCKLNGVDPFNADDYDYVLLLVKVENCSQSTFDLLFGAGATTAITGEASAQGMYDNSSDDWQYVVFDMRNNPYWAGNVNIFRFDFENVATAAGETMYMAAIYFAKDEEEMLAITRQGLDDPFVVETDPVVESKVENLLATPDKAPTVSNDKQNATAEDASLDLWFNHAYTKTPAEDITSTGWNTYTLRLAKNEAEGVHLLLASQGGHTGLTVSVTPFKNADGAELKTDLLYGYYFDDVDGQTIVDPTPPVLDGKTFDLDAGRSYMYIIKATSAIDSPAGQYSATVTVTDAEGKAIKTATVYAYVWNFVLPEETSCKTQMDLSWYNIYMAHECYEGDDSQLYKNYYDLLLANRVCSYTLPYATKGTFSDSRVIEYLDNPRVVAFNPLDWKTFDFSRLEYSTELVRTAYAFLSQKEEWLDKAYFYIVDEPHTNEHLEKILTAGQILKDNFPGYKMMAPMHVNYALNAENTEDYISYIDEYVNVWCYKPYFYTTFAEYSYDKSLTYRMSAGIEKNLGTFAERMDKEQAEGDELWWYVTRRPENPEITLLMDTESVRHRILFWQQKLYNVDSFLYYLSNDWYEIGENNGVNKKHETATGVDNFDCYGNGVLVYCGQDFDVYGGVGSLRLENVRDGIEDYEYLTILESFYGEEVTDALIHRLTTDISHYNTDTDNFTDLRIALGNIIEETIEKQGSK